MDDELIDRKASLHRIADGTTRDDIISDVANPVINSVNSRVFHCRKLGIKAGDIGRDRTTIGTVLADYCGQIFKRKSKIYTLAGRSNGVPRKNLAGSGIRFNLWHPYFLCIQTIFRSACSISFKSTYDYRFLSATGAAYTPFREAIPRWRKVRTIAFNDREISILFTDHILKSHCLKNMLWPFLAKDLNAKRKPPLWKKLNSANFRHVKEAS